MKQTYWNHKGTYQKVAEKLDLLIPREGEVANPKQNPCLEKYRQACQCYYDLFNNGLCNRAKQFRQVFGFAGTWIARENYPYCERLEQGLDLIILKAAAEQFVNRVVISQQKEG